MARNLLLGAGNDRRKKVDLTQKHEWEGELVTLDMNPDCNPTMVWDLENRPLPFEDESFDEIGAYDVLEHWGRQGDWRGWFDEMAEYHRLLKPGGLMSIVVPVGGDALADPGHTRFFHRNHFGFLNQAAYDEALEKQMPMTDYRWYWKLNFDIDFLEEIEDHHLAVILRKTP